MLRGIHAGSDIEALLKIPSVQGLRIFTEAIRARETVGPDTARGLEAAIHSYDRLLSRFTGGRSGLEAMLSNYVPGARQKRLSLSMQSLHRAQTQLMGCRMQRLVIADAVYPSDDSAFADAATIVAKYGVERLCHGTPLTMAAFSADTSEEARSAATKPLSPPPAKSSSVRAPEPASFILPELCSSRLPALRHVRVRGAITEDTLILPPNEPAIGETIDFVAGRRRERSIRAVPANDEIVWRTYVMSIPAVELVIMQLVHRSLSADDPDFRVAAHTYGPVNNPGVHMGILDGQNEVELPIATRQMSEGEASATESKDAELLRYLLRSIDRSFGEFHAFHVNVHYPPSQVAITTWYRARLPKGAAASPPTPITRTDLKPADLLVERT